MGLHGRSWNIMEYQWNIMECHQISGTSQNVIQGMMDYDGLATKLNGTSWKAFNRISMKQDGTSLTLIGFHKRSISQGIIEHDGMACKLMEYRGM